MSALSDQSGFVLTADEVGAVLEALLYYAWCEYAGREGDEPEHVDLIVSAERKLEATVSLS